MSTSEEADRILKQVMTYGTPFTPGPETAGEDIPRLTLAEYRDCVRDMTPPSAAQMLAFANYVAEAHSWYKHLRLYPADVPCLFLVNPCAMMEDVPPRFGLRRRFRPYPVDGQFLHYSNMPTEQYRREFGILAYSMRSRGRAIPIPSDAGPDPDGLTDAQLHEVPVEVMQSCTAFVSGCVHPNSAGTWLWDRFLKWDADEKWRSEGEIPNWLEEVLAVVRARTERTDRDDRIFELIRPERERQIQSMVSAMEGLKALLWS